MESILLDCGHEPIKDAYGINAGHGQDINGKTFCYACCAEQNKDSLRRKEPICLYLTEEPFGYKVSNWPGTLCLSVLERRTSKRGGGFGAQRIDVWFRFEGQLWHGINRGDNQILRCKPVKG